MAVDGGLGQKTLAAIQQVDEGENLALHHLLRRPKHYATISNKNAKYRTFIRGLVNRLVQVYEEIA